MTSSTEVMSNCSSHEHDSQIHTVSTPKRYKRSTSGLSYQSSPKKLSEEVQEEIEELLYNVPKVDNTFTVLNKIGSGTFSSVYVAKLKNHLNVNQLFALKHIIPTSHPSRIESELRCLYDIGGVKNVMGVKACFRERDHVVIVMPYFPHDKFQDYVRKLTVTDVREYMKNLLIALQRVHEVDIIHRDVKPSNFLFNRKLQQYALVDFGLAQKAPKLLKVTSETSETTETTQEYGAHRKTRSHSEGQSVSTKRKLNDDDAENVTEQRKRRQLSDSTQSRPVSTGLSIIDTNKQDVSNSNAINKPETNSKSCYMDSLAADVNLSLTSPSPGVMKPSYTKGVKSPRRALLTKRTLEQRRPLYGAGGSGTQAGGSNLGDGMRKSPVVIMEKGGKAMYQMMLPSSCHCFGKPVICSICMARSSQHAPRAGTPGFRAPEVLMKCPEQSTAVDVWSAGVIFLSLLSGRYPFFKAPDDMTALAQIISIVGSEEMKTAALSFGKHLMCNPKTPAVDLKLMCKQLRKNCNNKSGKSPAKDQNSDWDNIPDSAFDLLGKLMNVNPNTRITAEKAVNHPFFSETKHEQV